MRVFAAAPLRRNTKQILWHGSRTAGIVGFEGHKPSYAYGGDIGGGVYTALRPEDACGYAGRSGSVYELELNLPDDAIFYLGREDQQSVPGGEGEWVLVGEHVEPFSFEIKGQRYTVWGDESTDRVALELFRRHLGLTLYEEYTGIEFSAHWLNDREIIGGIQARLAREHALLTDADDFDFVFEVIDRRMVAEGLDRQINVDSDEWAREVESRAAPIMTSLQDLLDACYEEAIRIIGISIDLDEIGSIVREHGYRAVYFDRGSSHDELLVFYPEDLVLIAEHDALELC